MRAAVLIIVLLTILLTPISLKLVIGEPDFILLSVNREGELVKVYPSGNVERLKGFLYNSGLEVLGDKVYTVEAIQYYKNKSKRKYIVVYKRRISNGEVVERFLFPAIDRELGNLITPSAIEILPGGRIAVLDGYNDRVYIHRQEQRGSLITTIKLLSQHDSRFQSMEALVVGGSLIVMSDGRGKILKIDLTDYGVSVLKDFEHVGELTLNAMAYGSGYYFVASRNMIYAFKEGGEIIPLASVPSGDGIVGLAVVGSDLYASTSKGCIYRVDLLTTDVKTFVCGLGELRDLEVYYPHGPLPARFTLTPKETTARGETGERATSATVIRTTSGSEPEIFTTETSTSTSSLAGIEIAREWLLLLAIGILLAIIYWRKVKAGQ